MLFKHVGSSTDQFVPVFLRLVLRGDGCGRAITCAPGIWRCLSRRFPEQETDMSLLELEFAREAHPVDVIEHVANSNDWTFERTGDDEIAI